MLTFKKIVLTIVVFSFLFSSLSGITIHPALRYVSAEEVVINTAIKSEKVYSIAKDEAILLAKNDGNVKTEKWALQTSQIDCLYEQSIDSDSKTSLTEELFLEKIEQLKKQYPDGKYWNHANGRVASGRYKGTSLVGSSSCANSQCGTLVVGGQTLAYQCHGYALLLSDLVFGSNRNTDTANWKKTNYSKGTFSGTLYAGDVLRLYSTRDDSGHTVFVYKVTDDTVYYTDCNANRSCGIRWTAKKIANLKKEIVYVLHYSGNALTGNGKQQPTLSVQYHANGGIIPESVVVGHQYKVTHPDGLNFRETAGLSGKKIGVFPVGTSFEVAVKDTIKKDNFTWGKTTVNGKTGWVVISEYVKQTATMRNTDYYIFDSIIYRVDAQTPHVQIMTCGVTADFYNNTTFRLDRDGYIFLGWSLDQDGEEIISHDFKFLPEEICPQLRDGDMTIVVYARWELDVCKHEETVRVVSNATCTTDGYVSTFCLECEEEVSREVLPATGHRQLGSIREAATCTTDGYVSTFCLECEEEVSREILPATGHRHTVTIKLSPTCTEEGYISESCDDCGREVSREILPATKHKNRIVVRVDATCDVDGYLSTVCEDCGWEISVEILPMKGHTYKTVEKAPTCIESGGVSYTCHCGDSYFETIPATGHEYEKGICAVCGAKDPDAVKPGDVNGDGRINIADYALVKRSVLQTYTLNEAQKAAADVTGDGRINIADYTRIKRYVLGTLKEL